jgi:hypothetical protein
MIGLGCICRFRTTLHHCIGAQIIAKYTHKIPRNPVGMQRRPATLLLALLLAGESGCIITYMLVKHSPRSLEWVNFSGLPAGCHVAHRRGVWAPCGGLHVQTPRRVPITVAVNNPYTAVSMRATGETFMLQPSQGVSVPFCSFVNLVLSQLPQRRACQASAILVAKE